MALVHHSVLDEVVDLNSQPVYLPQRFNQSEIAEINQALGISQTSTSNYHQKNQSVSDNISTPTTPNSNNNLGTISLIIGILTLASLATYGIVKRFKKIKKSR